MPSLSPSPDEARAFVSLLRRYHDACTNAGLYEMRRSLSGEPVDASPFYDAIEAFRRGVVSTLEREDFLASHGWGFAFTWALANLKPIVNGTSRSMFVATVDGKRKVSFGPILQSLDRAAERIDDLEKAVEEGIAARGIKSDPAPPVCVRLGEGSEDPATSPEPTKIPNDRLPDYVTLDQAAAAVHRRKRTLERRKTKGTLPPPAVEGGGGKPDLWHWPELRPWLEEEFGVNLPDRFPGNPRRPTELTDTGRQS